MKKHKMRNGSGVQRVGRHTVRFFVVACAAMAAYAPIAASAAENVTDDAA